MRELRDRPANRREVRTFIFHPTTDLQSAAAAMDLSPLRRRRARPTCSRQKVMLCACLGLSARTIIPIPTAEAWAPAAPLLHGRGTAIDTTTTTTTRGGGGGGGGAVSYRAVFANKSRWGQQGFGTAFAVAAGGGGSGSSSGSGWGVAAPTATTTSPSAFSSRRSSWRGRPVASALQGVGAGAGARAGAGRRGRVGVVMSMAEEGRGGHSSAVLGALAIAGLGAAYYGLHDHAGGAGGLGTAATGSFSAYSASLKSVVETAKAGPDAATTALQGFLASSVTKIEALGPAGGLYFGLLYVLAEVLVIPAIPLTTAAGFLFGVAGGTAVVLTSASIAAAISFQLGRTLLREPVEGLLDENPKFRALDTAIAKEGFKVILLLRLSPIFPFALSNYLYGVTSVDFSEYMMGTLIGFFPGTLAYVYGGTLGKAMTDGGGMALPWYGYAGGAVLVAFLLKTVGDIATAAVEELEEADP